MARSHMCIRSTVSEVADRGSADLTRRPAGQSRRYLVSVSGEFPTSGDAPNLYPPLIKRDTLIRLLKVEAGWYESMLKTLSHFDNGCKAASCFRVTDVGF